MRFVLLTGIVAFCIGAVLLLWWYNGSTIVRSKVESQVRMDSDSVLVSPYSKNIFSHPYFKKADSFLEARNFDSAIYHYKAAVIKFNREGLLRGSVKALAKMGIAFK